MTVQRAEEARGEAVEGPGEGGDGVRIKLEEHLHACRQGESVKAGKKVNMEEDLRGPYRLPSPNRCDDTAIPPYVSISHECLSPPGSHAGM